MWEVRGGGAVEGGGGGAVEGGGGRGKLSLLEGEGVEMPESKELDYDSKAPDGICLHLA